MTTRECIFCGMARDSAHESPIYRDDQVFVLRDMYPKAPVHLLIIPHQHFTYLTGLTQEFYPVLGGMFATAQEMAQREGVGDTGYRLIVNQGDHAGQQVTHLHLHLLAGKPLGGMG